MSPERRIVTLPNILTGFRFAVVPFLILLFQPDTGKWIGLAGFAVFLAAALSDLADGYYARKHQSETILGKLMDPLADKVLTATALIMLIPMGRIPAWVSLLIIARELSITGLRGVAASSGIVVSASKLGKIKSVCQYIALCILIFPSDILPIPRLHDLGTIVLYLSLVLTIWSGFDYFNRFQRLFLGNRV